MEALTLRSCQHVAAFQGTDCGHDDMPLSVCWCQSLWHVWLPGQPRCQTTLPNATFILRPDCPEECSDGVAIGRPCQVSLEAAYCTSYLYMGCSAPSAPADESRAPCWFLAFFCFRTTPLISGSINFVQPFTTDGVLIPRACHIRLLPQCSVPGLVCVRCVL